MIIYSKLDVGKDMDLILINNKVNEQVSLEAMLKKRNIKSIEFIHTIRIYKLILKLSYK